jgi:hypothetical protein
MDAEEQLRHAVRCAYTNRRTWHGDWPDAAAARVRRIVRDELEVISVDPPAAWPVRR